MPIDPHEPPSPTGELRARLAADIAVGKTIALTTAEMADPELRRHLPRLLAELASASTSRIGPGMHVPGYTVLGEIGHGGMSTVYLARQDTLGRYVALKIAPWSGSDRKKRERLVQEARAMARVAHANIVAIHDIVEVGDTLAIAMEWVDGLTLEALLRALPEQQARDDMKLVRESLGAPPEAAGNFDASPVRFLVRVMLDITRAVHRVHQAGLLHLDIKPSNVLIRRDGTPLLADFGVVREMEPELANTRSFAGTPLYCAPEQLRRDDRGFGPHTDVYGLGITLYELLARQQPLQGHDLTKLVQAVEKGRIPLLGTKISIAKDLETIVQKAMAPEPQHRYASAGALAADLEAFLEGRPVAARPLSRTRRTQRWVRNEPWKAALLTVLLVTLPVVAYLGVELLLGMPHIEAGRLREQREQANRLKQAAYQQHFASQITTAQASDLLHEAMRLDPSDSSLACLASIVLDGNCDDAAKLLAQHPEALVRSTGLRLLAKKASERRPFFDASEVEQLAHSSQPLDLFALALDRVQWAEDEGEEEAYEAAAFHVDVAAMAGEPDPLLFGLRAWVSAQAGMRDVHDATCRVMHSHWPSCPEVLVWECLTRETTQPQEAAAIAHAWVERDPVSVQAWEQVVGSSFRTGNYGEALQLCERARAMPVASDALDYFYVALLTANGRAPEAKRALSAIPNLKLDFRKQLHLRNLEDPLSGKDLCDQYLKQSAASHEELFSIMTTAVKLKDVDLAKRTFQQWQDHFPYHRSIYRFYMQVLYRQQNMRGAADLARQIKSPRHRIDQDGPVLCPLLATGHFWPELEGVAQRWLRFGGAENQAQAASYAGLARSRLADLPTAARHLAIATIARETGKPTAWYTAALLEQAWIHVAPSTPSALRDPGAARELLTRFDAANGSLKKPLEGPWPQAVKAEVLFASGDTEAAIEAAETGLSQRVMPGTSTPGDCMDILRSALVRYGK
ncbi:MAG: serine/threonine-protein kinase [Planctomycetota bacterium]